MGALCSAVRCSRALTRNAVVDRPLSALHPTQSHRNVVLWGHGGGRRCQHESCLMSAESGGTPHYVAHGGGKRCQKVDCTKSGSWVTAFGQGARWLAGSPVCG